MNTRKRVLCVEEQADLMVFFGEHRGGWSKIASAYDLDTRRLSHWCAGGAASLPVMRKLEHLVGQVSLDLAEVVRISGMSQPNSGK